MRLSVTIKWIWCFCFPSILLSQTIDTTLARKLLEQSYVLSDSAQHQPALEAAQKSFQIFQQALGANHWKLGECLNQMAYSYLDMGQTQAAYPIFHKALFLIENEKGLQHPLTAQTLNNLGNYHYDLQQLDSAIYYYREALIIRNLLYPNGHPDLADSYNNMANCDLVLGQYANAINQYIKALNIRRKFLGDLHPDVASSYNNIASAFYYQGKRMEALDNFQEALTIRLETLPRSHPLIARTYSNIGNTYLELDQFYEALNYFLIALDIYQAHPQQNALAIASLQNSLGNSYLRLGEFQNAFKSHHAALETRLQVLPPEHPELAASYNNLGLVFQNRGDFAQALQYYQKALSVYQKVWETNHPDMASVYDNIGVCQCKMGVTQEAIESFEKALDIQQQFFGPDHPNMASVLTNRGNCYLHPKENKIYKALENFQQATDILQKYLGPKNPQLSQPYNNMGKFYYELGEWPLAIAAFQKALSLVEGNPQQYNADIAKYCLNIGTILQMQHDYSQAHFYFDKGLKAISKPLQVEIPTIEAPSELLGLLSGKASLHLKLYHSNKKEIHLDSAAFRYQQALILIDSIQVNFQEADSKQLLAEFHYSIYQGAIETAFLQWEITSKQSFLERAFQISEQSKALVLLESLKNAKATSFAGVPDSLILKEEAFRKEIAFWEKHRRGLTDSMLIQTNGKLFDLKQRYKSFIRDLETRYPKYYRLKFNFSTIDISGIQKELLMPDQALIEYFEGQGALFIFLITADRFEGIKVDLDFPLQDWVLALRLGVKNYASASSKQIENDSEQYTYISYQLYQKLIAPLQPSLLPSRLIIVPDNTLSYLPFELLLTQPPEVIHRFASHDYLLKKHSISYSYSATLLKELGNNPQKKPNKSFLAVAPTFENHPLGLSNLKFNKKEASLVQQLFSGEALLGSEATISNFLAKAPHYQIIHLATHGKANPNLETTYLAFSEPSKDSLTSLLYVRDLFPLRLNADMVVLSACETGLGEFKPGEGVISLARGFSYAGVPSTVTTLWSIDDAKTASLMETFYQYLKLGEPKDKALQLAKLDFINTHPNDEAHPYYWAAPVLIGESHAIEKVSFWNNGNILIAIFFILVVAIIFYVIRWRRRKVSNKKSLPL